jgi:iron complex outermembrane recepter protein
MSKLIGASVLRTLATAGTTAAALAAALPSVAQETPQADTADQEVLVTGSRIRRDPVEEPSPLQTLSSEDIDKSGEVSLGEYLQRLPISGSAINRSNNSSGNLGFPPDGGGISAGAAEIDLRYLTAKRVLVLVDGKRWVRGSSASGVSGAVDLNTIPVDAIERIEVLQDGASPIYGSDAIGGVVNVITRENFDGFNATAHLGSYDEGDGNTQEYNLSWGSVGETSKAFVTVAYARQDPVFSGDRALSSTPVAGAPPELGGSGGIPQGRFIFLDPRGDVNGDGDPDVVDIVLDTGAVNSGPGGLPLYDPNNPAGGAFHAFSTADRFNFQPFNYLVTPNRRVNLFAKGEADLAGDVGITFTGSFTNRKSSGQAAPNPLFMGSDAGAGFFLDNVFIPANHPFNPFGIDLDGRSNLITIARRPLEAGPRQFEQNVDTWVVGATIDGEFAFGSRAAYWDVNATWGRNNASQIGRNIFQARKLALALGDPAACAAVPGCVPFNIFGGQGTGAGSITPEMLAWATFRQSDQSEQELNDVTFNLAGELFNLPAGPFGYALGYEYRKEEGFFEPDANVQAGETADVPASPTEGGYKVNEAYLELRAPLLSDAPFAKRMELSAAVRSSDYDLSGRTEVFKGGLYWRMTDDFSFRFNWAEGFRAPNIGELFNTGSRFDSNINDPCDTAIPANAANRPNCAALNVPSTFTQLNQQISVQTGGNPLLEPEESESLTVGFAYSPRWADDVSWMDSLSFDVNYYDIELTNPIGAIRAQEQLDQCVATLDPALCGGIVRGGGGAIIAFANQLQNIGSGGGSVITTDGYDLAVTLTTRPAGWGQLRLNWASTYLDSFDDGQERAGRELGSPTRGFVELKSALIADWVLSSFTTTVGLRYLSSLDEGCLAGTEAFCSNGAAGNKIDSTLVTDAQLLWQPPAWEGVQLALGVNNLLDEDTPACQTCDMNNYDGTLHHVPGRFVYGRVGVRF